MSHESHMQNLLQELYKIEPDLRAQEPNLQKILSQMLLTKPEITISENFKKVLKNRLDSEIALQSANGVHTKNKYFRIFWYIAGAGALASFAVSFGFLSIFKTTPPHDTQPMIVSKIHAPELAQKESLSLEVTEESPLAMKRSMPESDNTSEKGMTGIAATDTSSPPKQIIPPSKPLASISVTGTISVEPSAVAMSLMTTADTPETTITSSGYSDMIAYVGEDFSVSSPREKSNNAEGYAGSMALKGPEASDMADKNISSDASIDASSTGTVSVSAGITSAEVISRAQAEADKLIPKSERGFYALSTPIMTYVSQNSTLAKDTVELVQVYVFPLVRTDGKESKIKEVQVIVP